MRIIWWLVYAFLSFRREITPREKTKRRHAKRRNNAIRKDEITQLEKTKSAARKDDKITVLNGVFSHCFFFLFFVFSCWNFDFSCSGFRYFVFSRGVISSFRMALFLFFVFSRDIFSSFSVALLRGEKTKGHKLATIVLYIVFKWNRDTNSSKTPVRQ